MTFKEAQAEVSKYLPYITPNSFIDLNGATTLIKGLVIMPNTEDEILKQKIVFEVIQNAKDNEYVLTALELLHFDLAVFAVIKISGNDIYIPFDGFKGAIEAVHNL